MNSMSIELALTTGMHRGEVCALRWSDFDDAGAMTVSHALGNGPGGFYLKEPKTGSFARHPPHQPHDDNAQGHAGRCIKDADSKMQNFKAETGPRPAE